jgi:hypothetical protein
MRIPRKLYVVLAIVVGAIAQFTGTSYANTQSAPPASVTFQLAGASVSADDVASGNVVILQDEVSLFKKGTKTNRCIRVHGFWNSGEAADGHLFWFWDHAWGTLCRNSHSPSGWVKVAGGITGRRCFNAAKPKGTPPGPVVKAKVILVRSLARLQLTLHATATAVASCDTSGSSAFAYGSASATLHVRLRTYLRAQSTKNTKVYARAYGKASSKAKAQVICATQVQTTPVPPNQTPPTQSQPTPKVSVVSVTSPEEVNNDGETYLIHAKVSAPNGHSITVTFSASFGSFPSWKYTITSSGIDQVDSVYVAPNDATAVGHNDQITVTVHDNTVVPSIPDGVGNSLLIPVVATPQPGGCC